MSSKGKSNAEADFLNLIGLNGIVREIVDRVPVLELPETWLVSGCLFQTVWNVLAGEAPTRAIKDYDIFYFDPSDITRESEQAVNRRAAEAFADLDCEVDVRNQARVHLWYAQPRPRHASESLVSDGAPRLLRHEGGALAVTVAGLESPSFPERVRGTARSAQDAPLRTARTLPLGPPPYGSHAPGTATRRRSGGAIAQPPGVG